MKRQVIWIIEDDTSIRWILNKALQKLDVDIELFETADTALAQLHSHQPDAVVCDIRMPGTSGLGFLSEFKASYAEIPVIVMTAYSDLQTTVEAFKKGAFDYLTKPFDINDALKVVEKALLHSKRETRNSEPPPLQSEHKIIGESTEIQKIYTAIGRLAHADIGVLINGESGTGKELVANAIYQNSPRSQQAFITINTAAIPTELLESELFGHEKGAFTGATARRIGRFEQADKGTLFLDEIGDMPVELQTRLLRVLQDGRFYRVGGHELIQSDVRIIAATNQDLSEMVKSGRFREDLYHRLNVIQIELPPLRNRKEDIELLINHFLIANSHSLGIEVKQLAPEVLDQLTQFQWPGNVRQLENTCRWMMVMAPSTTIELGDLPDYIYRHKPNHEVELIKSWQSMLSMAIHQSLVSENSELNKRYTTELESILYRKVLDYTDGHKIKAAEILGVSRNTITRKIKELKLSY